MLGAGEERVLEVEGNWDEGETEGAKNEQLSTSSISPYIVECKKHILRPSKAVSGIGGTRS